MVDTAQDDDRTLRFLELEYGYLQRAIDKFDEQRFRVKSWTVTAAGAILAFGISTASALVAGCALFVSLFFLYMETIYMEMQAKCIERSNHVEALLDHARTGRSAVALRDYTFGIGRVFVSARPWPRFGQVLRHRSHITVFYGGVSLAAAGGTVLAAVLH